MVGKGDVEISDYLNYTDYLRDGEVALGAAAPLVCLGGT